MSVVIFREKMWSLKKMLKFSGKFLVGILGVWVVAGTLVVAQQEPDPFTIIPSTPESAENVDTDFPRTEVWSGYNAQLKELQKLDDDQRLAAQLASGVMDWDTLLDYVVFLVRFLSQLGLAIGGVMVIYAGYLYAMQIFMGDESTKAKNSIKYAIIGIFVIASSYAIIRILTNAFL